MSAKPVHLIHATEEVNGHAAAPRTNVHAMEEHPQSEDGRYVSEELYWQTYYEHPDFNYEWNNGILEEKPMADVRNAAIYRWLLEVLESYLEAHAVVQLVNL